MNTELIKSSTHTLSNGEVINYVEIHNIPEAKLKQSLGKYKYTSILNTMSFNNVKGLVLNAKIVDDAIRFAAYANLKVYHDQLNEFASDGDSDDFDYSDFHEEDGIDDEELGDFEFEKTKEDQRNKINERHDIMMEAEKFIKEDDRCIRIPIVRYDDFVQVKNSNRNYAIGVNQMMHTPNDNNIRIKPFWHGAEYPIIVTYKATEGFLWLQPISIHAFENEKRLITLVKEKQVVLNDMESMMAQATDSFENKISFELNYDIIEVPEVDSEYYKEIANNMIAQRGFKNNIAKDFDRILMSLKEFRGKEFAGAKDIERLLERTISKMSSKSKAIRAKDIAQVIKFIDKNSESEGKMKKSSLDQLIGLETVKTQIGKLVNSILFEKRRAIELNIKTESHLSAVFIGNPGTAKTTVARYLGEILAEKNCLTQTIFREVTRKDLVGQYVGWTAMKVAKLFEEVKGGVLFIDEAYSLLNETGRDLFADEAINEIIFQMENNPDTFVIFAGYPREMEHFIQNANPGLKSRLANVVKFDDYSTTVLIDIFKRFVNNEKYQLENEVESEGILKEFIENMIKSGSHNIGNGRLMRKVFKKCIQSKASRLDDDMMTLLPEDIRNSCNEILLTERNEVLEHEVKNAIGF